MGAREAKVTQAKPSDEEPITKIPKFILASLGKIVNKSMTYVILVALKKLYNRYDEDEKITLKKQQFNT